MEINKEIHYENNILQKNENFFNYYINQKIIKEEEIDSFMLTINKELPITFRVLNNNKYSKFIHENIEKKLESICKNQYSIIKLNEKDKMYEIYLTRSEIKKQENYRNLYNYLINLNESGYIFRQELVSMLPVLFLKLKENFFVLDICAAPGSKTAQILDYMHLIKRRSIKNSLIKKFLQKNCIKMYKLIENIDNEDTEEECTHEYFKSENDNQNNNNKNLKNNYIQNGFMINDNNNDILMNEYDEENKEYNKKSLEKLYKSYYSILDNNLYDDKFFEYILNIDNNLYNDYKQLISNNNPNGVVVGNDSNFKRCCMLFHRLKNIHSGSLIVTNNNAIHFPYIYIKNEKECTFEKKYFDSVLCDVPCSGDGTIRKDKNVWLNWNAYNAYNLFQLQVNILKRSIDLTKENGYIVYSTCSLNPIENEAVICEIFNSIENLGSLKLINFENELLTKLNYKKGLTEWKILMDDKWFETYEEFCDYLTSNNSMKHKKIYDKIQKGMFPLSKEFSELINLRYAKRFFPHNYDAGGFFIAVIKKCGKVQWKNKMKNENINENNIRKFENGEFTKNRKKGKYNKKKKNKKKKIITYENNKKQIKKNDTNDKESNDNIFETYKNSIESSMHDNKLIVRNNEIINAINKKSEEELNNYIKGEINTTEYAFEDEKLNNSELLNNKLNSNVNLNSKSKEHKVKQKNENLIKQQEYVSWDYYEKFCKDNILEKIKSYFNLNDDFLSIKNNLYIHLMDDKNFNKLSVNERINMNIKKINLVSNHAKDILECYTKIKLKVITAGITVIQIDKNKNNSQENYYRINYSGCLNFIPYFKEVDNFLLNKTYRDNIIKIYFNPIYENKDREFNFDTYMENLIDERRNTVSKINSNKKIKEKEEQKNMYDRDEIKDKEIDNDIKNNKKSEELEIVNNFGKNDNMVLNNNIQEKNNEIDKCVNKNSIINKKIYEKNISKDKNDEDDELCIDNKIKNYINITWVNSDVILDLIKVDKSKLNSITDETIKQTEKLKQYSPNVLLTLNRNKQIFAIPSNKGRIYVDISIEKNSIIMLPYILN
ncbi:tRNA m5C-methyltransferase, putative [Plasmodium relictum]|uniref:tRNA m5C-methyltransferase, putative n=1 Tax=Plasmodium relictum TaxID=85471 RepID=A0A1J1H133_PLARL|nr:tRNA m5C-methyltransferase, putative [Plasmodium relictum]CRG98372.1 tRNA m5C-methyltransferase, putative [Plasmodium relictum]